MWLWYQYRPITVGTTLTFVLFYVIYNKNIAISIKRIFLILIPMLLMMYHPSEYILLPIFVVPPLLLKLLHHKDFLLLLLGYIVSIIPYFLLIGFRLQVMVLVCIATTLMALILVIQRFFIDIKSQQFCHNLKSSWFR